MGASPGVAGSVLEGDTDATDAVFAAQEGAAAGNRTQGGGAAAHWEEATRSSKQSPEPLVPASEGAGMSPSGRVRECQGHYKFPALH